MSTKAAAVISLIALLAGVASVSIALIRAGHWITGAILTLLIFGSVAIRVPSEGGTGHQTYDHGTE